MLDLVRNPEDRFSHVAAHIPRCKVEIEGLGIITFNEPHYEKTNNVGSEQVRQTELYKHRKC